MPDLTGTMDATPRQRVVRQVTDWLEKGRFAPGEPLPSARSISRALKIDPRTVGAALDVLEEDGVVRQRTSGRWVARSPQSAGDALFSRSVLILGTGIALPPDRFHSQPGFIDHIEIGARQRMNQRGWHAVFLSTERLHEQIQDLLRAKPIGLILSAPEFTAGPLKEVLDEARQNGLRVAVYGDSGGFDAFDCVRSDHRQGGRMVVEWIIGQGARRPVQLASEEHRGEPWQEERFDGYKEACAAHGLEVVPLLYIPKLKTSSGNPDKFRPLAHEVAGYLAPAFTGPQPPDALLVPSDGQTYVVAAACRLLHREPNRDIKIAGYDNYWRDSPERMLESSVPLVTVDKHNEQIGAALVDLLAARVAGELPDQPQVRFVETSLVSVEQIPEERTRT